MQTGTAISGIAHLTLIGWVILRGVFSVETEPVRVTEVALVSAEEYAALSAPVQAPEASQVPPGLDQPDDPAAEPPPPEVSQEVAPERQDPTPPEPPEVAPEAPPEPEVAQPPAPELADELPDMAQPPSEDTTALLPQEPVPDQRPQPRPIEREAATPAPPQPPDARPDPVTEAPVAPEGQQEEAPEAETAAAPEEAVDTPPDPESEPEETAQVPAPVAGAPTASVRPPTRPARPTPPAAETPPTQTAQPEPEVAEQDQDRSQAVDDAVAAALGQAGAGAPAPTGPPLTGGEQEALRVAVSQCWSVGSLSSSALATTVVVGVSMTPDGRPQTNSIRLVSWSGGDQTAAQQAFGAARRAIIRCGQQGYPLPADKYEQWRDIEMTFNPEKMQYR